MSAKFSTQVGPHRQSPVRKWRVTIDVEKGQPDYADFRALGRWDIDFTAASTYVRRRLVGYAWTERGALWKARRALRKARARSEQERVNTARTNARIAAQGTHTLKEKEL